MNDKSTEQSMMDDLADAWAESEETLEPKAEEEQAEEQAEEPAIGLPEADEEPTQGEETPEVDDTDQPEDDDAGEPVEDDVAPRALSAVAREEWKNTPEAVRKDIVKREADFERGIAKYRDGAQRAEQMDGALAPFQQFFAMNGNNPAQTVQGVLQTASILQMGSPQQKADMVANMIKQFGVDIAALDNALVGGQPQQPAAMTPDQVQELVRQQMAQQQQQYYQQQQATTQQEVEAELNAFANDPKNEFYSEVAPLMFDLVQGAANRGQALSLEQAYDQACMIHPEVKKVMDIRKMATANQQKAPTKAVPKGRQSGAPAPREPETVAEFISQAWDQAGQV